ncbi:MAG: CHAD domain-containing protein [Egibacteraceae bacterium]
MAYRFILTETIPDGVHRIANEQVQGALDRLDHLAGFDPKTVEDAVHDVRKRCKKLRGLLRLVRPAIPDAYPRANAAFRDAALQLSPIRDAHALLATFDCLVAAHTDQLPCDGISEVREGLAARARSATLAVADQKARVGRARDLLVEGKSHIEGASFDDDFSPLSAGLVKTYKQGRNRFEDSTEQPCDEALHEWRKRVKYSWYHARLLRDSAPSMIKPLVGALHHLGDALGDDHDLAVLTGQLRSSPDEFGGTASVSWALVIVDDSRADLQRRATQAGARLYVERPRAFGDRMSGYWKSWRVFGEELPVGAISDLSGPDDSLDRLTKEQLYRKARQLDLAGRSSMDRRELVAAVRAAGGGC